MEKKSLSTGFIVMILVGIILIVYSFIIQVPSEELSYYSYDGVSQIEKYLNGDAYNYVVGANIVGSKIVAATIKKAIFNCFGLFMTTFGIGMLIYGKRAVENEQATPKVDVKPAPKDNLYVNDQGKRTLEQTSQTTIDKEING